MKTESIESFEKSGIQIIPDFLSSRELTEVQNDFELHYQQGRFKKAGIGKGTHHQIQSQIRNDETFWVDASEYTLPQSMLMEKMNELKNQMNQNYFLGLHSLEAHYALYPPGGFYQRHRDAFQKDPSRVLSVVLYLNPNWHPTDGGCLRIYQKNENESETFIDTSPSGGKLVCFLSREIEHEVLTSHSPRMSFTGWFKTR